MTLLVHDRPALDDALGPRRAHGPVVLVPTMGALHEGHATLLRVAREHADAAARGVGGAGTRGTVVASVFVNPLQFGAGEDLDRYPRTLDADLALCEAEDVDLVLAPSVETVYPDGDPQVTVKPGPLGKVLEGRTRKGHFAGVLTVVAKLFGLVRPDVAVFGQKDYQQLVLVRRMVADLCFSGSSGPLQVVGAPTDREPDGLARSSRNRYLDDEQRREAAALHRVLRAAVEGAEHGVDVAVAEARAELRRAPGVDLDYLAVLDPDLRELPADPPPGTPARVLVAARVGTTRLIDNLPAVVGARQED